MSLNEFHAAYVAVEDRGDAVVARFTRPQLSEDENLEQMGQELLSLVDQYHCRQLVLSLELVDFITSAALGKLITLHRRMHAHDLRFDACTAVRARLHCSSGLTFEQEQCHARVPDQPPRA